ncbi:PREDICTED: dedicator of cytokinesis protein 10-like [Amphimedon queenslandica]|uniref:C2 DOCK-type domain-containing protein n=1 Tax=Amphimedon queenslandica TaxID=400682 RepID=A0AAN0JI67_AMPQE|nr:PREDICTED: dedicator of cytokinesis protein 10-like [Amphimedon queenslandica]|eukprot:XP_019856720.1 PREDICTED: dedicator of cytokinesis protein 10-like [Amphimedon queenslandica]
MYILMPLFLSEDEVNVHCTDLGPIYRQEREKLTDTELIKILSDFKNIGRHKLQTIPGSLNVSIIGSATPGVIFTPSYLPVKSTVPRQLTPDTQASLEVREFLSLDSYDSFSHCSPHISHINHFYVYPVSLKYDTQKSFPKARNIAVTIEVRDNDTDRYTRPLKVIYSKSSSDELLVDSVTTPVLYHCTYPSFYDEIKIQLPTRINRRHHLLFTFKHISCDIQKIAKGGGASGRGSVKHNSIETIVGYSWLPLLGNDGRINSESLLLPVLAAAELPPAYLSITRKDLEKKEFPIPDGVKW